MSTLIWWVGYTFLALWLQEGFQGVDFLSPGLIVFLQAEQWKGGFWSALVWGIMQEGTGALAFGSVLVFDVGLVVMFVMGKWLLEPENPLFVLVLSIFLVLWRELVVMSLASLQGLVVSWPPLPFMALQFAAYLITWALIYPLFSKVVSRAGD